MTPIPRPLRALMAIVIGVSIPEGLSLLLGPPDWYATIWGWHVTALSARFIAGIYLSVSLGFVLAWREGDWESARIPLAMLWSFALVALLSASVTDTLGQGQVITSRPFTWVWVGLYAISVVGGLYYYIAFPSSNTPPTTTGAPPT